ncbi:MAG: CVNH domain-containing protein, partial [Candidatus Dadabacteria bacterium]|nr:CVNH domain-containing protein [Candidatus Dadabacteria bacterium]
MNKKSEYHLIIIPVLMFFLILLSFHTSASAQGNLPPGSYKKSCKDIQLVAGNVLWAMCEKGDGKFQKSTLRLFDCEGDISNNNGVLTCKKKPGKRPPKGSYQNSCKDIQVEGKQLRAKCQKRNGSWNKTKINYKKCSGDIRNDNGELSCKGGEGSKIPKGSYGETCRDSY